MSAFVSEASIGRLSAQSQGNGTRPKGGAEEADSPFADLLDSCAVSDPDPAECPSRTGEAPAAGNVSGETKSQTEKPVGPENLQADANGENEEEISAELMLLLALGGQPVPEAKEEKKATGIIPGEIVAKDAQSDAGDPQPEGDTSQTTDTDTTQPVSVQTIVAAAAPLPIPAESAAPTFTPESVDVTPTAAIDVSSQNDIDNTGAEKTSRSTEAIAATLSAQADKNKTTQAEKPTSAAAERTLETPAAFRSAAGTKELPSGETPKAVPPEQGPPALPKDAAATPKNPPSETSDAAAKTAGPQPTPVPDAPANAPAVSVSLPTSVHAAHQVVQAAPVHADPAAIHVPISGLAIEIAAHAQAGKNRFEIRLDPPELGRIDVRLDVGSDGQVTSHLRVERAETLDLLRRDAPMLERALQQAGLKTSDSGLQFSLHNQSFSWQQQGREMPDVARIVVQDETLPPVETQRQYGRLAGLGSGVDIRV